MASGGATKPSAPAKAPKAPKAAVLGKAKSARAELPAIFAEPLHESLLHEAARADLAARRRNTASTLRRSEVAMTGAKAWRQKGTGRARAGALSAPQRRGGGVAFGPKPRRAGVPKVNRKARRRALRSALAVHAARGSVAVLDADGFGEPSTRRAAEGLEAWGERRPTLVVIGDAEEAVARSFRNIERVSVTAAEDVGVADLLAAASLVVSGSALEVLASRAEAR